MIISDEQVRLALEYLHTNGTPVPTHAADGLPLGISPELVERVRSRLSASPDVRDDRVADGRRFLDSGVTSAEVASKMVGRIISDAIR